MLDIVLSGLVLFKLFVLAGQPWQLFIRGKEMLFRYWEVGVEF